jgi:hypothetical protein
VRRCDEDDGGGDQHDREDAHPRKDTRALNRGRLGGGL